jgi:hypothetical protein
MGDIVTAIAPAFCATIIAAIAVWAVRPRLFGGEGAPTEGGTLLGLCFEAAVRLALLAWPEMRSEVARMSVIAKPKGWFRGRARC